MGTHSHLMHPMLAAIFFGFIGLKYCAQEYCDPSYCGTSINVGCNPPPLTGGPLCTGKNASVVVINATIQALILSVHNRLRNQLAIGNLAGFASAQRMPTLAWDETLAAQAGHNARSCNFAHDACRNTAKYAYAGQNLATLSFSGQSKTVESLVRKMVGAWWSEYQDATQALVDHFPSNYTGPAIGHFMQMASDQASVIGCAMQYWVEDMFEMYYLVCNYERSPFINEAVYKKGAVASECTTGTNQEYVGLCALSRANEPSRTYIVKNPARITHDQAVI
ncbi:antigen 5 like allergen Cul n 1-like [Anopheles aquasalis]|uniref:antigen 5 like allergen Cul n 1-like n=1 Tax=Anopheles aquasalis TaxID=42839 RepID=UPI00215A24C5|nr:antigen 5 like allergen Cul n 1-like [Anopheles aquasalis]